MRMNHVEILYTEKLRVELDFNGRYFCDEYFENFLNFQMIGGVCIQLTLPSLYYVKLLCSAVLEAVFPSA